MVNRKKNRVFDFFINFFIIILVAYCVGSLMWVMFGDYLALVAV